MTTRLAVYWNGQRVGWVTNPEVDNYHFFGPWVPDDSALTRTFLSRLTTGAVETVRIGDGVPELVGRIDTPPDEDGVIEFSI